MQWETHTQPQIRLANQVVRKAELRFRHFTVRQWFNGALKYDPNHDHSSEKMVTIGNMSKQCLKCGAKKSNDETPGMCCSNGRINLPVLPDPPEPLRSLLRGNTLDSRYFLNSIRQSNCAFQMTSFGANIIRGSGFISTFKVQGQVYHQIGPLLHLPNQEPGFMQLYFVGDMQQQAQTRNTISNDTRFNIVLNLEHARRYNEPACNVITAKGISF